MKIKRINGGKLPEYKREGDACLDCYANGGHITIFSGKRKLVPLGFAVEIPEGYEGIIRPRSGLSSQGIDNAIGTIDSNYRGEVKACVINNTDFAFHIADGERICQLAIRKTEHIEFEEVSELSDTDRGDKGFGSTGV